MSFWSIALSTNFNNQFADTLPVNCWFVIEWIWWMKITAKIGIYRSRLFDNDWPSGGWTKLSAESEEGAPIRARSSLSRNPDIFWDWSVPSQRNVTRFQNSNNKDLKKLIFHKNVPVCNSPPPRNLSGFFLRSKESWRTYAKWNHVQVEWWGVLVISWGS